MAVCVCVCSSLCVRERAAQANRVIGAVRACPLYLYEGQGQPVKSLESRPHRAAWCVRVTGPRRVAFAQDSPFKPAHRVWHVAWPEGPHRVVVAKALPTATCCGRLEGPQVVGQFVCAVGWSHCFEGPPTARGAVERPLRRVCVCVCVCAACPVRAGGLAGGVSCCLSSL